MQVPTDRLLIYRTLPIEVWPVVVGETSSPPFRKSIENRNPVRNAEAGSVMQSARNAVGYPTGIWNGTSEHRHRLPLRGIPNLRVIRARRRFFWASGLVRRVGRNRRSTL